MTLSDDLLWRNQIKDRTFPDVNWLNTPRTFYLGSDCSSDSLQVGNLAVYMLARRLAQAGWKPVLLVGGATSLIGDPGGKETERELKSREEIAANVRGIAAQVQTLLGDAEVTLVDNYDWFKDIGYLEFLRDVGKHYSMTELLQREYITERLGEGGSGISYAEFSYSLVQGYDYWHLNEHHDVELQIGGSDQWGNMLSGVPLIRKKSGREVHAMSMPLVINKATGKKFGKSESGTIWLDPAKTTPTAFYQFWINADDEGVDNYLRIYTEFDRPTIEAIMAEHVSDPGRRHAQRQLAAAVTTLVHGADSAQIAEHVTDVLTGNRSIDDVSDAGLEALRQEIPSARAAVGAEIISLLVETGLAVSTSEARRLMASNGISLNGQKSQRDQLSAEDFTSGRILLRKGKKFRDSALIEVA
ncbi:MAG: tyrS [Candidatus Saccharibacteria bacterium]|nr:tyrS [Candidatus Saccharibacteria bacterium]